jgi:DNA polymerase-4
LILEEAKNLLYQEKLLNSVRLIGISLSNLNVNKVNKPPSKKMLKSEQLSLPF